MMRARRSTGPRAGEAEAVVLPFIPCLRRAASDAWAPPGPARPTVVRERLPAAPAVARPMVDPALSVADGDRGPDWPGREAWRSVAPITLVRGRRLCLRRCGPRACFPFLPSIQRLSLRRRRRRVRRAAIRRHGTPRRMPYVLPRGHCARLPATHQHSTYRSLTRRPSGGMS